MSVYIAGYEIDVALAEEHSFDSEVTEHPVETGADVADHVRARPIVVTVEGVVSNTPIGDLALRRNQFLSVGGEAFAMPSDEVFAFLLDIRDKREPVTIETTLRRFENMVLESLSAPRSRETGDAFRFSATFKQIQLVTNARSTIKVAVPRASAKIDRGNKASPEVPALTPKQAEILAVWESGGVAL